MSQSRQSLRANSPFGDIVKSRCMRGMQEETRKWAVGERKESLQWSLINFPFHPRNPRTLQSMKTVTTIVPQIRKVTTPWNSVRPILGSQYSIGNPSLSLIQLRENHNEPVCFEGWNKFSVQLWYPENQIWHTDNSYLTQREKAIFFLCWSSFRSEFSNHRQNTGFGNKSIKFLHFRENLGLS